MSLHFQYQFFIYLFGFLALLVLLYFLYLRWKKRKIRLIGDQQLVRGMIAGYAAVRSHGKFVMLSVAFAAGILAVMHLREPGDSGGISRKGIDVVLALDVSRSMLSTDLAPSRLDRARQFMQKLVDQMPNDRIGLVLFAGQAYLQMPLTTDHGAASLYISTASTESVPSQGTIVSEALRRSANAFNAAERRFKAVVFNF
ncbi:MAG: VWA domain-containing protein [Chitinophagaceae bacterium]|nr:VWA domain-containing protein [Chitinophagaceae bacterium]